MAIAAPLAYPSARRSGGRGRPRQHLPDGRRSGLRIAPTQAGRSRSILVTLGLGTLVVAGIFAVVVLHVVIDQKQFRIDAMQSRLATADARHTALQYQLSQLESPQRIIANAVRLGMIEPAQVTYLTPVPSGTALISPTTSPPGSAGSRAPGR